MNTDLRFKRERYRGKDGAPSKKKKRPDPYHWRGARGDAPPVSTRLKGRATPKKGARGTPFRGTGGKGTLPRRSPRRSMKKMSESLPSVKKAATHRRRDNRARSRTR